MDYIGRKLCAHGVGFEVEGKNLFVPKVNWSSREALNGKSSLANVVRKSLS